MSTRPFYEMIYHVDGWTLADAFRPQPGWGTRRFSVGADKLGDHTESDLVVAARHHAPPNHRLTSVTLYPAEGPERVIWSTPPCPLCKALAKAAPGVKASQEPQQGKP